MGALTHSLENSSTFTFARARALVISRTMPGRSWPTISSLACRPLVAAGRGFVGADDDGKAAALEGLQGVEQRLAFFDRQLDAQNAGELAAEPAHAAFQPVAAVIGHHARHRFNEAGAVRADDRHHQGNLHNVLLNLRGVAGK